MFSAKVSIVFTVKKFVLKYLAQYFIVNLDLLLVHVYQYYYK